jgi:hypothetical protein
MTDAELEAAYPAIPWREPIHVTVTGGASNLACRYCIAHYGLAAKDVANLYNYVTYTEHLQQFHQPSNE